MKSVSLGRLVSSTGLVLALSFLAAPTSTVMAQGKGSARGGAGSLARHSKVRAEQTAPSATQHHQANAACAKCQNRTVTLPDTETRGGGAKVLMAHGLPTKTVTTHLCEGCQTSWSVKGHGKQKKSVATHTCTMSGEKSSNCCKVKS